MTSATGVHRLKAADYRAAIQRACSPSKIEEVFKGLVQMATIHKDDAERRAAIDLLLRHTKGPAAPAKPAVDPLKLTKVTDAESALKAYQELTEAVAEGTVCADSANVYRELIDGATRIATGKGAESGPQVPYTIQLVPHVPPPKEGA